MKTLVLVFTCLQIFGQDGICAIFKKFTISKGKRFTTSFDLATTLSRIDCCTRCVSTDGCLSVNFENSSKQCQLVSLPSSHLHNGTEAASGWDIYSIYGILRNMPMQYTAIFHGCKNDNFQIKNVNMLFLL